MDIISSVGTLASIAGVGLSIWVLRVAKNTKSVLEHHVIGPGLSSRVQFFLDVLNPMLGESYDGKDRELHTGMNKCLADLKSLRSHTPKDRTPKIDEVIKGIESIVKLSEYPKNRTTGIRDGLVYIIQDNSNFRSDSLIL
jgi:hypothetical protein